MGSSFWSDFAGLTSANVWPFAHIDKSMLAATYVCFRNTVSAVRRDRAIVVSNIPELVLKMHD